MTSIGSATPAELAAAWSVADPDPVTAEQTRELLDTGGDHLADVFSGRLSFGTAGLRGPMRTGPTGMNRVLVRIAAAAVADTAVAGEFGSADDPHLIVGFDARHGSADFALDTARIAIARGAHCTVLSAPLPTPVLAFAVRHLGATAGVMVTASHNPRTDNGYKVYGSNGALLGSPTDAAIAARMDAQPLLTDDDLAPIEAVARADASLVEAYLATITAPFAGRGSRPLTVAHTALHGVGDATLTAAFEQAGFAPPHRVDSQAEPDPDFPSAAFPNPEEPGTLDDLLALAASVDADLAIANDPDADRLAVAVPDGGAWRLLSGDQVGCLLADHLLRRPSDDPRPALVVNTVTSSRMLGRIAAHYGATHATTLTGFKWIMSAQADHPDHRLVVGYEEALGYAVNPDVQDKDGISAALAVADLAADLRRDGRTIIDRLREIEATHGALASGQRAIRVAGVADQADLMARLRTHPPAALASESVTRVLDLLDGAEGLPPTDGVVLELDDARITVRPSGTEPKTKVYGEASTVARVRALIGATVDHATAFDRPPPPDPDAPTAAEQEALRMFTDHDPPTDDLLRLMVTAMDLTTLEGDDTPARIRALCATARRPDPSDASIGPVAAVCVYPAFVPLARELLDGTPIAVATVAGAFPHGLSGFDSRVADIAAAVEAGADEIDIVIDRSLVIDDHLDRLAEELAEARRIVGDRHLKVIIEAGELPGVEAIRATTTVVAESGADFVKTSTGKAKVNATPEAVAAMADGVAAHVAGGGAPVGIKVAGGVRTAAEAAGYLHLVAARLGSDWMSPARFRFGASSLLNDVLASRDT
ncbi:MAG: deoxyribose-phosphate aldolase [Actinomycetota bacterium]